MTPFEKACTKLGIEIIRAHSPQAKGRVERNHAVYQDRFLKELKLRDIKSIEEANQLLKATFCDTLNDKFSKPPREKADYHRKVPKGLKLEEVFVHEQRRRIANDWTISYGANLYQIHADNRPLPKPKDHVIVRTSLEGKMSILYRDKKLLFAPIAAPPPKLKPVAPPAPSRPKVKTKPPQTHPWRKNITHLFAEASNETRTV